jgi:hypothetical protein
MYPQSCNTLVSKHLISSYYPGILVDAYEAVARPNGRLAQERITHGRLNVRVCKALGCMSTWALFVCKCMKTAGAAAVAAVRQQPN